MKYKVGDLVIISDDIKHDTGYKGQIGTICNVYNYPNGKKDCEYLSDYSVFAFDKRANRFWCCGFTENDIRCTGLLVNDAVTEYNQWMKSQYNTDTHIRIENEKEDNHSNNVINPLDIISVPMQWDGRDCKLMWDKINEIIGYINR